MLEVPVIDSIGGYKNLGYKNYPSTANSNTDGNFPKNNSLRVLRVESWIHVLQT